MSKLLISNAFSLNMLNGAAGKSLKVDAADKRVIKELIRDHVLESCVGHADTAAVFSDVLGVKVEAVRSTVSLDVGDTLYVGQYVGPRLQEGCSTLPEGATIVWLKVSVA